jgi:hypothetical protein
MLKPTSEPSKNKNVYMPPILKTALMCNPKLFNGNLKRLKTYELKVNHF